MLYQQRQKTHSIIKSNIMNQLQIKQQTSLNYLRELIDKSLFIAPVIGSKDLTVTDQIELFDLINLNHKDSALVLHLEELDEFNQRVFCFRFIGTSATPSFSAFTFDKCLKTISDRAIIKRSETLRHFKSISMTDDEKEVFEDAVRLVTDYLLTCYSYEKRQSDRSSDIELIWKDKSSTFKPSEEMCEELCLPLSIHLEDNHHEYIQEIIFLTLNNVFFHSDFFITHK